VITLIVTSLSGESEILTDYTQLVRKRRVNGDYSLSFLLLKTERNQHSFDLVEEESVIEYDGILYHIKGLVEQFRGQPIKSITAYHVFYDIIDDRIYTALTTGAKSINEVLSFIFNGTDCTFSVIDSFPTVEFENFGNDSCLTLFQKVIDRYQAEFEIVGNNINIKKQIGSTIDFQFRFGHNIKTFKKSINTNNLSTYIKGYGKQNEDGSYVVEAEYTSPYADRYKDENGNVKLKHAPPYSNDSITQYDTLMDNLKANIQDTPEMSIELEFVTLQNAGYPFANPGLGDTVPTIYEPLNVDVELRILEIEEYPEAKKSPKVTLSNVPKSFVNTVMNYSKQLLDKIYDDNSGKLRYNVYDDAVKRATEALNNSLTELEYPPNMGIVARDPNNPNRFVVFRSAGLGITTDGGATFKEAITADGVTTELLTAGQIKTNNIQIIGNDNLFYWDGTKLIAIDANDPTKYVQLNSDGFVVKKGMIDVERDDGFKTIIGGQLNQSFDIQGSDPPGIVDVTIPLDSRFFASDGAVTAANGGTCNIYTFTRVARYVVFQVAIMSSVQNAQSSVILVESGAEDTWLANVYTLNTEEDVKTFYVDLGIPDGSTFALKMMLKSWQSDNTAYCRKIRAYQTDFLPS
jgi:phage minor structural protein